MSKTVTTSSCEFQWVSKTLKEWWILCLETTRMKHAYLYDMRVFSTYLQEHMTNLEKILARLYYVNPTSKFKCINPNIWSCKRIIYIHIDIHICHIICTESVQLNLYKIKAAKNYPLPKTPNEINRFFDLLWYNRKFIPNVARITKPLTQYFKKGFYLCLTLSNNNYSFCSRQWRRYLLVIFLMEMASLNVSIFIKM